MPKRAFPEWIFRAIGLRGIKPQRFIASVSGLCLFLSHVKKKRLAHSVEMWVHAG